MQRRGMGMAWPPLTKNIKITLGILVGLWLVALQVQGPSGASLAQSLGLTEEWLASLGWYDARYGGPIAKYFYVSREAVFSGKVWTLFTYAFWHEDFSHILFNGVALWMFGAELDARWSDGKFWKVSLLSALGGGIAILAAQSLVGLAWYLLAGQMPITPVTLGYSGAVMGLVGAFCWVNWDRRLHFFFAEMTGKSLLALFVVLDFVLVFVAGENISISGHLGGLVTGLLLVSDYWRPSRLKRAYRRWKQKQKFNKHAKGPDSGGRRWN